MRAVDDAVEVDVTLQPTASSLRVERIREIFDQSKNDACLGSVRLCDIRIGKIEVTLSGKIKRSAGPCRQSGPNRGGSPPSSSPGCIAPPRSARCHSSVPVEFTDWRGFDFSRIASGPLYFYVGAGLSMAAGLVGWSEMACLIWTYCSRFEGKEALRCPDDWADDNERFLDDFIHERINDEDAESAAILSRVASEDPDEWKGLGRTAVLNMLLRYRAPRVRLIPEKGEAVVDPKTPLRARPGEEPSQEDLMVHSMIWRSGCHGVFTTNYDMLLEHAFSIYHHGAALRTYRYQADFLRFVLSNPRFVLKLHGDINDIGTMVFCPRQAWSGREFSRDCRGEDLERVYHSALDRGHMIYLGCGFRDETIRRLHQCWTPGDESSAYCRIGLLRYKDLTERVTAREIQRTPTQGIELLSFGEYWEVKEFMEKVVSERSGARERWAPCPEASDLHRQLFLSWDPTRARRSFATEPWSCRGVPIPS